MKLFLLPILFALFVVDADAQILEERLGPAPIAAVQDLGTIDNALSQPQAEAAVTVDIHSRYDVSLLYLGVYVPESSVTNGWSGSVATCNADATASAYQDATLERINVYRALAGLPGNVALFSGTTNQSGDQQAALMMVANKALSHTPPVNWLCYTAAGATAASNSNLTLGTGFNYNGPRAIAGYMDDSGGNNTAVGHRRWILYPTQAHMTTGDVDANAGSAGYSSNALWVIGGAGARPSTPNGIAWPPRGYVPYQLLPSTSNRWSLSIQNADFTNASVSMTRNGVALAMPAIDPFEFNGQPNGSFIGDNTLVWEPTGVTYTKPTADVVYHVSVSGIAGSGVPTSVSYDVTVIDPNDEVFGDGLGG
ncbi:MAG: hypothetical protein ABJB01_07970 [Rudaea sp.]